MLAGLLNDSGATHIINYVVYQFSIYSCLWRQRENTVPSLGVKIRVGLGVWFSGHFSPQHLYNLI